MDLLLVGCEVLIGVVFAVAAFSKLRSRAALRSFASSLAMLPERFRMPVAGVVASGEAAAAVLMAVPQAGLPLSGLLLCAFSAAISVSIRRGHQVSCRCLFRLQAQGYAEAAVA
ncbi:MauE/DoxX family redox-associated membrane protein [Nonomuraea sp. 3N208]|uniref:MauE/DoxX family redox-associated membrane protein n=1 Tax=Nonomuraea sp. 3N208 TaxID=3457421 RepID=UPI003FD5A128